MCFSLSLCIFPLCWRFIFRWCGLHIRHFGKDLLAIPRCHPSTPLAGIHLGYVIHVTHRACEIEEKSSVSVEPVWRFLLLLVVCFCLSRRFCSLAVDTQEVCTHGKEGGKGRREPGTSAGRQAVPCTPAGWRSASCGFTWPRSQSSKQGLGFVRAGA